MPMAAGGVCSDPASRLPWSRRCAATLRMRRRGHLGQENPLSSSQNPVSAAPRSSAFGEVTSLQGHVILASVPS